MFPAEIRVFESIMNRVLVLLYEKFTILILDTVLYVFLHQLCKYVLQ